MPACVRACVHARLHAWRTRALVSYSRTWWTAPENMGRSIEITGQRNKRVKSKNVRRIACLCTRTRTRTAGELASPGYTPVHYRKCMSVFTTTGVVLRSASNCMNTKNFQIIPFVFPDEPWRRDISLWNSMQNALPQHITEHKQTLLIHLDIHVYRYSVSKKGKMLTNCQCFFMRFDFYLVIFDTLLHKGLFSFYFGTREQKVFFKSFGFCLKVN